MALGTTASRALGFVRNSAVAAALGVHDVGDPFNLGNSVPNTIYQMLIGGVLASVFVPELVRAAQTHRDGGAAYTDRLLTISGIALLVLTAGAVAAAPFLVDVYSPYGPGPERDLTIAFARYCLPQVFFYGVFNLLGQILAARDRFAAMMWAPVLNNVVSIGVFGLYIGVGYHAEHADGVTPGATALLGVGSTLGIVVQALALVPSIRRSGYRWRPRFDWRGTGLGRPIRSAGWALLLVVATQVSWAVISRLSADAGHRAELAHLPDAVGIASYTNAYAFFVIPQGIITISLVTAVLPRMSRAATAGRYRAIGTDLAGVLRSSAAPVVTATVLFLALAPQISAVAYRHSQVHAGDARVIAETLVAFAIGIPAFCAQYALARGFYALGDARTPFWLTLLTTATNAGLAGAAYLTLPLRQIIVGMALGQSAACLLGVAVTGVVLGRRLRAAVAANGQDATARGPRGRIRSGLDGGGVTLLHGAIGLACLPGALAGHWAAGRIGTALGDGTAGNLAGLAAGSAAVLISLFLFARPLGAGPAVAPLARRLRIRYPA
ncbi:murein biosynthesis integral membrane protein MurJ [Kitasatospora paranensis]